MRRWGGLLRHQALLPCFSPITAYLVRHTVNKSIDSLLLAPVYLAMLLRSAVTRPFIPAHLCLPSRSGRDVEGPSAKGGQELCHCKQETARSLTECTDPGLVLCDSQASAVLFSLQAVYHAALRLSQALTLPLMPRCQRHPSRSQSSWVRWLHWFAHSSLTIQTVRRHGQDT